MKFSLAIVIIAALSMPAFSQHAHQHKQHAPGNYAGLQQREIKALSNEEVAGLRQGRGMGLALAAELNGFPGPMHVLELKDKLQLTPEQIQRFQHLFEKMKAEAIDAGEAVITNERALDRQFSQGNMTPEALTRLTTQIGEAQGRLRAVHLKYHLSSTDLLSVEQRQRYAEFRGYR